MIRKVYRTRRLEIAPYQMNGYDIFSQACTASGSKKNQWDISSPKLTLSQYKKMVFRHRVRAKKDELYIWGIFERKSGHLVGVIDVHVMDRMNLQFANLGYRIFNHKWRRGFAYEALAKLIKLILLDLKLNRLEAVIDEDNLASIKLVQSLGLRFEGVRKNYWYQKKRWDDQIVYVADREQLALPILHPF